MPSPATDPLLLATRLAEIAVNVARIAAKDPDNDLLAHLAAETLDEIEETAAKIAREFGSPAPAVPHLSLVGKPSA